MRTFPMTESIYSKSEVVKFLASLLFRISQLSSSRYFRTHFIGYVNVPRDDSWRPFAQAGSVRRLELGYTLYFWIKRARMFTALLPC